MQREEAHGSGKIVTQAGDEIPVHYHLQVERNVSDEGTPEVVISGRLSIIGDPWLESTVINEGKQLVLQDGHRLRVRVEPAGRSATSLPFSAMPIGLETTQ